MNASTWLPLSTLALVALAACGGSTETTPTGSTTSAATGSGGSGAGGSDVTVGATTGATSGTGGAVGDTLTLTMETFTVPPGGEVYKCQNYANPFGGTPADVSAFESHMTGGSHHLLLFYKKNATNTPEADCSGLEFAATPYSTQLPDDTLEFPAGVAAQVPTNQGFRLQSHYLNTTDKPIEAHVQLTFHLAKPGTVKDHAGVLFVVEPQFSIQPNSTQVVNHTCTLPYDMNLIKAGSHMHKHGTHFDATIGAQKVFETTTWDEPKPALFAPAMPVKGGDKLDFNCTFVNNSAQTLTFGESAETNEMCIFVSSFYPVPDGTITVGCN
jgi:copper type II ascorbate-dependent monooxygenase-like protein